MKNEKCAVWTALKLQVLEKYTLFPVEVCQCFHHLNIFFSLCLLFLREEISTLSRQASFRRMNSISTDPRGAVLLLNYSFHAECIYCPTAASSFNVFCYVGTTWFGLSGFLTPLIKKSVDYRSHMFLLFSRTVFQKRYYNEYLILCSKTTSAAVIAWPTLFVFPRKQVLEVLECHDGRQTYFWVLAKFECVLILSATSNPALCFFNLQTEESIPLRVEGTIRTSLSSLGVSLRIYLSLHAGPGPGTEALLSRCQMAKFWASTFQIWM